MKTHQLILAILLPLFLVSCGKVKETKKNIKEAKEGIGAIGKMANEAKKMTEGIEELANTEPLTSDDFKEWMPESIGDLQRTGFKNNALGAMNVSSSEATYKSEDGAQQIKITIIDGAGTGSFAIAGIRMASSIDMEEQDEYGYKKTVTKNGVKAMEEFKNRNNQTTLMFLHDERFGVTIDGRGMEAEEVWNKLDDMNLNQLSKMEN